MTTEPENAPGAVETPAPPVPAFSSGVSESAQPSSGVDLDQLAEKLTPKLASLIENTVDKRFQSGKDKRFADLEKVKRYLDAAGGDVSKAAREMQVDEILSQQASGQAGGTANRETPEQVQQKVALEVGELLTEAGIPYADPEYVALTQKNYPSPAHFQKDVTRLIAKRAKQGANPGVAAAAGDGGGGTPGAGPDLDKLYAQLNEAQRTSNHAERQRLSELIRQKGGRA